MMKFNLTAEQLAQKFHEIYERLAPEHGYETRKASAVPWADVPANNKSLMIAVCNEILTKELIARPFTVVEAFEESKKWRMTDEED
jgi:hypothetical protein